LEARSYQNAETRSGSNFNKAFEEERVMNNFLLHSVQQIIQLERARRFRWSSDDSLRAQTKGDGAS
jgi:hypothetical protein